MNANVYVIEDYDNVTATGQKKQTQFKPNLVRRRRIANEQKNECFLENSTAGRYSANCVLLKLIELLTFF